MFPAFLLLGVFLPLALYWAQIITSAAVIVTIGGWVLGIIGAPTFLQWVKHAFHATDKAALIVVYLTCFAVAALALFISGEVGIADLTLSNFFAVANAILASSVFTYKVLMGSPDVRHA